MGWVLEEAEDEDRSNISNQPPPLFADWSRFSQSKQTIYFTSLSLLGDVKKRPRASNSHLEIIIGVIMMMIIIIIVIIIIIIIRKVCFSFSLFVYLSFCFPVRVR